VGPVIPTAVEGALSWLSNDCRRSQIYARRTTAVMFSRMCVKLREGDAVEFLRELIILCGENQED
jgi:hypothetical protein